MRCQCELEALPKGHLSVRIDLVSHWGKPFIGCGDKCLIQRKGTLKDQAQIDKYLKPNPANIAPPRTPEVL